ncbi:MAG: hypothetical protein IKW89_12670 [Bacteroidales bacterium]|nr:hypothetical protein [Bacteroidales bacterium]
MFEEHLKFYQDFPTPGIKFVDIIPYLQDRKVFSEVITEVGRLVTAPSLACPEARAFLFASPLLIADCGVENIILFRKRGKLPYSGNDLQTIEIMKEYGADKLIYRNSDIAAGKAEDGVFHVSIVDDVLATGGTAEGIAKALEATKLVIDGKEYGVKVNEFIFIVELDGLNARDRLSEIAPVYSIARV